MCGLFISKRQIAGLKRKSDVHLHINDAGNPKTATENLSLTTDKQQEDEEVTRAATRIIPLAALEATIVESIRAGTMSMQIRH